MEKNNRGERRKYKRIKILYLSLPIELKINNIKEKISGLISDISPKGLGILSFKRINEGSIIDLKLYLKNLKTNNIVSKVVWTKQENENFKIGLEYINISPKDFFNIYNYVQNFLSSNFDKKSI